MMPSHQDLPALLHLTRRIIPAAMVALGLGYAVIEFLWPGAETETRVRLLLGASMLGLVGPFLAWLTLTWALRAAEAHVITERQLQKRTRQLAALNAFSLKAAASLELEQILAAALEEAIGTLGADSGRVYLLHAKRGDYQLNAWQGLPGRDPPSEPVLSPGYCLCGQALEHGNIILRGDIQNDPAVIGRACWQEGLRSVACVPLTEDGRALGVLQLASAQAHHFESDQREFLAALVSPLIIAMENARLYSQVCSFNEALEQKVAERTRSLVETQTALNEKTLLLERTLDRLHRLQEEERARIAQDLHDGVVQLIAGTLLQIEAAREALECQPGTTLLRLEDIQKLLLEIEAETRRAIFNLNPPSLGVYGLAASLQKLVEGYRQRFGIKCALNVQGAAHLAPQVEIAAYRIIQEALQNAAVHAHPGEVRINLDANPTELRAMICDNGQGFDLSAALAEDGHLGLIGMLERARQAGGNVSIESNPGKGTTVHLRLPPNPLTAFPHDSHSNSPG